jgi:hypothetical protein
MKTEARKIFALSGAPADELIHEIKNSVQQQKKGIAFLRKI